MLPEIKRKPRNEVGKSMAERKKKAFTYRKRSDETRSLAQSGAGRHDFPK